MQKELNYEIINKILIIKFENEVNSINQYDFDKLLKEQAEHYETLILDFTKITYINSTSIGFLIQLSKNIKIYIISPESTFVKNIYHILRLDKLFKIFKTIEDALKELSSEKAS